MPKPATTRIDEELAARLGAVIVSPGRAAILDTALRREIALRVFLATARGEGREDEDRFALIGHTFERWPELGLAITNLLNADDALSVAIDAEVAARPPTMPK